MKILNYPLILLRSIFILVCKTIANYLEDVKKQSNYWRMHYDASNYYRVNYRYYDFYGRAL